MITPDKLLAALCMRRVASEDDHGLNLSVYYQFENVYLLDGWIDVVQVCEELNK